MFKIILLSSIFMANAFAGTVILEKNAVSGYVQPEHSYVKNCQILSNGYMESTIVSGDGAVEGQAKQISKRKLHWIKMLLSKSQAGIVEVLPYPCDGGSSTLQGWVSGDLVELDIARDCSDRRINTSKTVEFLRKITESICGF